MSEQTATEEEGEWWWTPLYCRQQVNICRHEVEHLTRPDRRPMTPFLDAQHAVWVEEAKKQLAHWERKLEEALQRERRDAPPCHA